MDRTTFTPSDPAKTPDLAIKMSVRTRLHSFLRTGARTPDEIEAELDDVKPDTIERTIRRYKTEFTVIQGGKIGLTEIGA